MSRRELIALTVVALILRLLAVAKFHDVNQDGFESAWIAQQLVAGNGYSWTHYGSLTPTAFQYPLYTFLLAANFLGSNGYLPVLLLQALISTISCALMPRFAAIFVDAPAAKGSAWLWALHPVSIYWCTRAQPLTIELLLLMLLLLASHAAIHDFSTRKWAIVGAILGLAILSKTLYAIWMLPILAWAHLNGAKQLIKGAAICAGIAFLVVTPWMIRNKVTLDAWVISTNSGHSLWIGAHPLNEGGTFAADGTLIAAHVDAEASERLSHMSDVEADQFFRSEAIALIQEDPMRWLSVIPKKMIALWWFDASMPSSHSTIRTVTWVVEGILALVGAWLLRREWRRFAVFFGMYAVMCVVYAIYFGGARFRYAVEPSFVIFAAHALEQLRQRIT